MRLKQVAAIETNITEWNGVGETYNKNVSYLTSEYKSNVCNSRNTYIIV